MGGGGGGGGSFLEGPIQKMGDLKTQALDTIGRVFDTIQPSIEGAAQNVRGAYEWALGNERDIFNTAATQLNQLRQQRAADAQEMAQQLGFPVQISEFTDPVDVTERGFPFQAAGTSLSALANMGASVAEAEAFAGRVMPLMREEESKRVIQFYDAQIAGAELEMARLNAEARERQADRMLQAQIAERQMQLDQLRADRDYELAKASLANENKRIALEKIAMSLNIAETTGYYKGKPTQRAKEFSQQVALDMRNLDLQEQNMLMDNQLGWANLTEGQRQFNITTKEQKRQEKLKRREAINQAMGAMIQGGEESTLVWADPTTSGAFPYSASPTGYAATVKVPYQGIRTKWEMYNALRGLGYTRVESRNAVRRHFNAPKWVPKEDLPKPSGSGNWPVGSSPDAPTGGYGGSG